MELAVGDNVRLKSGGLVMAIEHIENGKAICVWAFESGLKRETLDLRVLEKDKPLDVRRRSAISFGM